MPAGALFAPAAEPSGFPESPRNHRSHALTINALVLGERLRVELGYSENLHERETVERWAERFAARLRTLLAHCRELAAAGCTVFTPSDFPLAHLDRAALERALA